MCLEIPNSARNPNRDMTSAERISSLQSNIYGRNDIFYLLNAIRAEVIGTRGEQESSKLSSRLGKWSDAYEVVH